PRQSLPDVGREPRVRAAAVRVSHRVSRLPEGSPRDRQLPDQLRRVRLRPGDHRPGGGGALSHRGDRGAHALLSRGVLRELSRVHRLRAAHPRRPLLVPPQQVGSPALAPVRQPPRPLHAPRLKGLARPPGGVAVYVLVMGVVVVTRHVALRTHALDLGYYVQVVWSLAHGHGARVTLPPMHAWGDHFSPILYLFVPLGWLAPGAIALLLARTARFAAGAVVMAGFATRRLGDARAAAGFAVLYLLNPTLHGINVRDVHPTAFAIPLVIAAAWAVDAGRPAGAAVAVVAALAGREDAAIAGVGFGVWLAAARRRWAV